jgi:hypothetical protein
VIESATTLSRAGLVDSESVKAYLYAAGLGTVTITGLNSADATALEFPRLLLFSLFRHKS